MSNLNSTFSKMETYEIVDWKFGLITRSVERIRNGNFLIHDTSCGWMIAEVTEDTLNKLTKGEIALSSLAWG